MKITENQLKAMIRAALKEAVSDKESKDSELVSFLDEVDKGIEKCVSDLYSLIEKGEKLAAKDLENKDRNTMVIAALGTLKKAHGACLNTMTALKKGVV